jgi:hypothetical protein
MALLAGARTGMMGQLLSKDILYEPMKELSDKVRPRIGACARRH